MADIVREFLESTLDTPTSLRFERDLNIPYLYNLLTKLKFIPEQDAPPPEIEMHHTVRKVLVTQLADTPTPRVESWLRGALDHDRVSGLILLNRIRTLVRGRIGIPVRPARIREEVEEKAVPCIQERLILEERAAYRASERKRMNHHKGVYAENEKVMMEHWKKSQERMKSSKLYDLRQEEKIKFREIHATIHDRVRISKEVAALPLPPKPPKSEIDPNAVSDSKSKAGKSAQGSSAKGGQSKGKNAPAVVADIPADRRPAKEPWELFRARLTQQLEHAMQGPDGIGTVATAYADAAKEKIKNKREQYRIQKIKEELELIKAKAPVEEAPDTSEMDAKRDAANIVDQLWKDANTKQEQYEEYLLRLEKQRMREQDVNMARTRIFTSMNFAGEAATRFSVVEQIRKARKAQNKVESQERAIKHTPMMEAIVNKLIDFAWDLEKNRVGMGDLKSALCP